MTKALEGIRIIDMTHNQAGPACAQILAFLGADVIKLEEPKGGDVARRNMRDKPDSDSLFFLLFNANKKSLTLNLKTGRGKELFRALIEKSDVLLENFGPGALDRLGFGFDALSQINPRLIYATIKGFGTYGPYRDYKSYEPIAQAMGGCDEHHRLSRKPADLCRPGDRRQRHRHAHGDRHPRRACSSATRPAAAKQVEVSMQDAVVNIIRVSLRDHQRFGAPMPRRGNQMGRRCPEHDLSLRPGRPERLCLHHRAAADVARLLRSDRPAGARPRPALSERGRALGKPRGADRDHRGMDARPLEARGRCASSAPPASRAAPARTPARSWPTRI